MGKSGQLEMFDGREVAGVQNKIAGANFGLDAQPTREIKAHEEGFAIVRWRCKPSHRITEATTENDDIVQVRVQDLEVLAFYEVDAATGRLLHDEGRDAAIEVLRERGTLTPKPSAVAS